MNDYLYNNFFGLWGNESDVFRRLKDSCVIWINEKDESKLIRKEKNHPRRKEKKFGEISVRDIEVSFDGDPRRFVGAIGMLIYHERGFVDCHYFVN